MEIEVDLSLRDRVKVRKSVPAVKTSSIRRVFLRLGRLRSMITALGYGFVAPIKLRMWMLLKYLARRAKNRDPPHLISWQSELEGLTILQFLQLFPQAEPHEGLALNLNRALHAPASV